MTFLNGTGCRAAVGTSIRAGALVGTRCAPSTMLVAVYSVAALAFRAPTIRMSAGDANTQINLPELLSTCIDAAQRGCAEIRRVHESLQRECDVITNECAVDESEVDYKIKGDPRSALTAADLAAQTAVVDALERAWPGLQIVGEEDLACSVDSDASSGNVCASELLAGTEDSNALRRDLCKELERADGAAKDICASLSTRSMARASLLKAACGMYRRSLAYQCAASPSRGPSACRLRVEAAIPMRPSYTLVGSGPPRVYGERAEPTDPVHGGGIPTDGERPLLVAGDVNDSASLPCTRRRSPMAAATCS